MSVIRNPLFLTKKVIEIFDCDLPWACYSRLLICHMSLACDIDYRCTSTQCVNRKKVMARVTEKSMFRDELYCNYLRDTAHL